MKDPLFSIITITLNAVDALRQTIESVNGQTYARIEHIIIDGGSSDGSVALITRLARRDVHWISEPDHGIADAFNKGTKHACGAYLCYLNAGDVFVSSDVLQRTADLITVNTTRSPTVFYGDFISVSGGVQRQHSASATLEDFAWDNPINHQSAFIPFALARSYPYDTRLLLGMDYDFWLRVAPVAQLQKLPFPIARFEMGGRSSTPAWEVHGLVMHRVLWHLHRGSRIELRDILVWLLRAGRFKLYYVVRQILGPRLSLAIRAARSRRLQQNHAVLHRFA